MSKTAVKIDKNFTTRIADKSGVDFSACYQCLKCTAGCPVAELTDSSPAHMIRTVLLGLKDEALSSDFLWLCVGCETCKTRCPQDISARRVVDALKELALEEGRDIAEPNVALLYKHFLNIIRARGRMNEPLLMAHYKWGSKDFTGDRDLGMVMLKKGKIRYSGKIRDTGTIRNIIGEAR